MDCKWPWELVVEEDVDCKPGRSELNELIGKLSNELKHYNSNLTIFLCDDRSATLNNEELQWQKGIDIFTISTTDTKSFTCVDSGASVAVSPFKEDFLSVFKNSPVRIRGVNGISTGYYGFFHKYNLNLTKGVFLVSAPKRLISTNSLNEVGWRVVLSPNESYLSKDNIKLSLGKHNNLPTVDF